jgi:N-dimethylarginine dimethylaminohydrolase
MSWSELGHVPEFLLHRSWSMVYVWQQEVDGPDPFHRLYAQHKVLQERAQQREVAVALEREEKVWGVYHF